MFFFCILLNFDASQFASMIFGDERYQVPHTTVYLLMSTSIEWIIRNGNKFSITKFETITFVSVTY